jgi:hypothetical protein
MWIGSLKSNDDTCSELDSSVLDVHHQHARFNSAYGAFAPLLHFDSDSSFEAAATRQMCGHMDAGGAQFIAPYYGQHLFGKVKRYWYTIRDSASSAMMHTTFLTYSMLLCAVSTVVYLRNRAFNRAVGLSCSVPLTLITLVDPNASKFHVFGCIVFAKVHDKLHHKLGEKALRDVKFGYPSEAMAGYRVYNQDTRGIATSVHIMF